jgi:MoxR-like ATPase
MWTRFENKIIVSGGSIPAGATRLLAGRAAVLPKGAPQPPAADYRDWQEIAKRLAQLQNEVARRFVGRDEMAQAVAVALAAGEHVFVFSPPGAAKSSLLRAFAEGIQGRFFRAVLNPDLPREALFGSLDPAALQAGRWERRWDGLATCDLAFLDETWKASPQVANMLLDALEERRVSGAGERSIPLLSALGASNEVPEEKSMAAIYDRFLIRLSVDYVADPGGFRALLTADAGATPIPALLTAEEVRLLSAVIEAQAGAPDSEMSDALLTLWQEFRQRGISDRRWRRTLKTACALAALEGARPVTRHLATARWTLWTEPDEEKEVRNTIVGLTDPLAAQVLNLEALLSDLQVKSTQAIQDGKSDEKTRAMRMARDLKKEAEGLAGPASHYGARVRNVITSAQEIVNAILEAM